MHLIFPADSFNAKIVDEEYSAEYLAAKEQGIPCSLISLKDLEYAKEITPQSDRLTQATQT